MRWPIGLTSSDLKIIRLILLFPIGAIYGTIAMLRRKLYNKKKQRFTPSTLPIISIGNLAVGGTGKTPHTEYLIRMLKDSFRVATLSRGYKRSSSGYILAESSDTAELIGDEPIQMHQKFPEVNVAVCESRKEGIERLTELAPPPQVILLDDAYQHLAVKAHLQILLTDYASPYPTDFPLPAGNLREFRCAAKEADNIIVTKCPPTLNTKEAESIKKRMHLQPHQQCFFSTLQYDAPLPLTESARQIKLDTKSHILLFTGIAHPESLIGYLSSQYTDVKSITFSDHHRFCEKEIVRLCQKLASSTPKTVLFTTEKDAARLYGTPLWNLVSGMPLFALPVRVKLLWDEDLLKQQVLTVMEQMKR